jgi:hypothetical protein
MKHSGNGHKDKGVLSATTMIGDRVRNEAGEDLGKVEEIMIDYTTGALHTQSCPLVDFLEWETNCLPFPGKL